MGLTVSQKIAEKEVAGQSFYAVRQFHNVKNADAVKSGRILPMFRRNVLPPPTWPNTSLPDYKASHLGWQSLTWAPRISYFLNSERCCDGIHSGLEETSGFRAAGLPGLLVTLWPTAGTCGSSQRRIVLSCREVHIVQRVLLRQATAFSWRFHRREHGNQLLFPPPSEPPWPAAMRLRLICMPMQHAELTLIEGSAPVDNVITW
jgi:hypothetical protein